MSLSKNFQDALSEGNFECISTRKVRYLLTPEILAFHVELEAMCLTYLF